MLPGALVAVAVGIILNEVFKGSSLEIAKEHLVNLPVPQSAEDFKKLITFPDFNGFLDLKVWILGATIAVVASIETLLCIEASDRMDVHKRITDTNLELKAQGIGNLISSFIGGLPMTSVVVRSSANANAGATSKSSSIIHGVFMLICVLTIPFLLNKIPLATLAACAFISRLQVGEPCEANPFLEKRKIPVFTIYCHIDCSCSSGSFKRRCLGIGFSIFYLLQGNMKRAYYFSKEELEDADEVRINLAEEVSFLNKAAIKKTLKNIESNSKVIISASKTSYISDDIIEMIEDFANVRAVEENTRRSSGRFKTSYKEYADDQHSHVTVTHKRTI